MVRSSASVLAHDVVVFDFETTGLSPKMGDRAIEIGAVRMRDGVVVERFQQLMNPGRRIPHFIEQFTGITNDMIVDAPPCRAVMNDFAAFIKDDPLVAHNASFDQRFLVAEFDHCGCQLKPAIACSLLVSRRLLPDLVSHTLGDLVHALAIPQQGTFHRALADAEMTAALWLKLLDLLNEACPDKQACCPDFMIMQRLAKVAKAKVPAWIAQTFGAS